MTWQEVVELLELVPHPEEGGFFRETYRSNSSFTPGGAFVGPRSVGTAIYYLLAPGTFSAMHRLPGDELFHFYLGDPVEMLMLFPDGTTEIVRLGSDLASCRPQHLVPGGAWQGSRLVSGGDFALLGTTMGPGFDYADYETGSADLLDAYPERREMISDLLAGLGAS